MRTTIDLPDDLHQLVRHLAQQTNRSTNDIVLELIRNGLDRAPGPDVSGPRGMPQLSVRRPVTADDIRASDDDG